MDTGSEMTQVSQFKEHKVPVQGSHSPCVGRDHRPHRAPISQSEGSSRRNAKSDMGT